MTAEENAKPDYCARSEIGEIGNRVRYIQRRLAEIGERVEENYHLLREVVDSSTRENGADWYHLSEEESGY